MGVTRGYGVLEGFLAQLRHRKAEQLIPPALRNGRILDVGCGSYPLFLMKTSFSEKYALDKIVDEDSSGIETEKIVFKNFDVEHEDVLPFQDNFFDVVTMLAVFEHLDPDILSRLTREVRRILKPEGVYVLTTPAAHADGALHFMSKLKLVSPVEIGEHKKTYTPFEIQSFLQGSGFIKQNIQLGYFELFFNIWGVAKK